MCCTSFRPTRPTLKRSGSAQGVQKVFSAFIGVQGGSEIIPSSKFYLFGQNFSNCRPLLWITFLVKTGVWWHDGNVEEHQMSIHPRMSFIDQDAVELCPFEVNDGAAVGGEWELSMSPRKRITMTSPRLCASKETRDPSIVWTCRVRKPHGVT